METACRTQSRWWLPAIFLFLVCSVTPQTQSSPAQTINPTIKFSDDTAKYNSVDFTESGNLMLVSMPNNISVYSKNGPQWSDSSLSLHSNALPTEAISAAKISPNGSYVAAIRKTSV